jgi:hypothetical protein
MRTCATASIVAILGIPLVVTFAACAGGSPSDGTTPDDKTTSDAKKDDSAAVRKDEPKTDMPDPAATAEPKEAGKPKEPMTTAECVAIPAEAVTDGDAGVVMNNAQTAADAGRSDRFAGVNEIVKSKRKSFRCCYDIWAKTHPKQIVTFKFGFELSPDGTLKSASVKKDESPPAAAEFEPCLVEVAKSITFPKSPSGRDTKFNYPFDFKPH